MGPWLNWIEQLTTDQWIVDSNSAGLTMSPLTRMCSGVFIFPQDPPGGKLYHLEERVNIVIILASTSPRRKEIFEITGLPFEIKPSQVDETLLKESISDPARLVEKLAEAKAAAVFAQYPEAIVIGADTIVVLGQEQLGKPRNQAEAVAMLRSLSGKKHQVMTGVAIFSPTKSKIFHEVADVTFYPWDAVQEQFIQHYVASGAAYDKAGGYGIQDQGSYLIREIHGDFFTVMGLPLAPTVRALQEILPPGEALASGIHTLNG